MSSRPVPRPIVAILASLALVALVASYLPAIGGESKRSTTWSSASSGKAVRSETRREKGGDYTYSNTYSDSRDEDGPAEVDAWTFSREDGHWRNTSGSERDWRDAQAAIDGVDGDVFWFRRGDERYLTTDPAALRGLAELFAPQEELGRKQGELGYRQGELGRLQGELGRKQGQLGRIQARLGVHQASVSRASRRDRELDDELERQQQEISRQQNEAGELQSELGEQQAALGERQAKLGEQQAALGQEQERVSKEIAIALGKLTRELIADGKAKSIGR
jgi:bla regulator protein blaR1